jgi:hypothetical protein
MMQDNRKSETKIGAYVLETLTTGMYTNPLDSLREYVQNSFDSIKDAEELGILPGNGGRIDIIIDKEKRSLKIRDNGKGVAVAEIKNLLMNIGMSSKSIESNAGFRGIGRLAGIAYCDRLMFKTQMKDEKEISQLTFNCVELRKSMSASMRQVEELSKIFSGYSDIENYISRKKDHFFEVIMEGINPEVEIFLNWKKIKEYLSQTAPLGFDAQTFPLTGDILEWLKEHNITMPTVSLKINDGLLNVEVFKPYEKLTYSTKREHYKVHVKGINFYPKDASSESPFWIWYAETNLPGMISDDMVSGLRLRKNNISIGGVDRVTEIFEDVAKSHFRFNAYFLGEIHIQNPNIIPNARRDGFEDTSSWVQICEELKEFAKLRIKEVHDASKSRNIDIEKLIRPAVREIENVESRKKTGLASKVERDSLIKKIKKQEEKLESAIKSERSETDLKKIRGVKSKLVSAKNYLEKIINFTTQNLNSALDRKQVKIIKEIIEILYDVLPEIEFEKARDAILAKYQVNAKEDKD